MPGDLIVDGAIRTIPRSSSTCNANHNGAIYYDTEDDLVYICKNGGWDEFTGPKGDPGIAGTTYATCTNGGPYNDVSCSCGSATRLSRVWTSSGVGYYCEATSDTGNCRGMGGGNPIGGGRGSCCVCQAP